jgi:hypothetical protein
VELMLVHEGADGLVAGTAGKLGAEPGGFTRGVHQENDARLTMDCREEHGNF